MRVVQSESQNVRHSFRECEILSRRVAESYLNQRDLLGFPWLTEQSTGTIKPNTDMKLQQFEAADFVMEIGTEELPVEDLNSAMGQVKP